jgi:hypothetical protein
MAKNMQTTITRDQFTAALQSIQDQIEKDRDNAKLLQMVFHESTIVTYDNSPVLGGFIKLLSELMGESNTEWIDWYLWECAFCPTGTKVGIVVHGGKEHKIQTPSDLYDFLELANFSEKV